MTTANEVITGAMKDLGVLERNESPQGQEALDALDILNQMCSSWIHNDLDMEWITISDLSAVVPYPDDQIGPIRYNLAMRLAPTFDVMPSPFLAQMAGDGYKQLQREYVVIDTLDLDSSLRRYNQPNTGALT